MHIYIEVMCMNYLFFVLIFLSNFLYGQGFVQGTLVKTADGYKVIEKVQPGDYVYCSDIKSSCARQATVKAVTQQWSKSIVAIIIGDTTIISGPEHLFYLPQEQRWEQAQYLTPDHILTNYQHEQVRITDVQHIHEPAQLFDLTVDKQHTFFVSEQAIVVHNNVITIFVKLAENVPTIVENAARLVGAGAVVWGSRKYNKSRLDNYHHQQFYQEAQTKRDSQVYGIENVDGTVTAVHASSTCDPRGTTTIDFAEANRQIEIREAECIKQIEQQKKGDQQVQKNVPKNKQQDKPKQQAQPHVEQKQPSVQPPKDPKDDERKKSKVEISKEDWHHIFRDEEGHLPYTPENEKLLIDTASDINNYLETDKWGTEWYAKTLSNGKQVWATVRNGIIRNGGLNKIPKTVNPGNGLCKSIPIKRK